MRILFLPDCAVDTTEGKAALAIADVVLDIGDRGAYEPVTIVKNLYKNDVGVHFSLPLLPAIVLELINRMWTRARYGKDLR